VIWFWVVVLVLVVGGVAVLAAGRDVTMSEAYEDRPDRTIPAGRALTSDDLQRVRFSSALRGYRMDEVDALIDRLAADLAAREADLREARRASDPSTPIDPDSTDPETEAEPAAAHTADASPAHVADETTDEPARAEHASTDDTTEHATTAPESTPVSPPEAAPDQGPARHRGAATSSDHTRG
jgi:DivIVA domain-containing protein